MSDQHRLSPYNINTITCRKVMRIKKMSIRGLFVDPIPNSPSKHRKNYMADIKENYLCDLEVEGLRERGSWE